MAEPEFDIAVSFAGEDREFVEAVVRMLQDAGVHVFYDVDQRVELWGRDLVEEFEEIYRKRAFRTLMFISAAYSEKAWTTHERRAAMARMLENPDEPYILQVRLDDTELPGLPPTLGYLDARDRQPDGVVEATLKHLATSGRELRLQPEDIRERSREPRKVSVSSVVGEDDGQWYVKYKIVNGSAYQIHTIVLVVDDLGMEGDPADQAGGTALELIIGTLGPGGVDEGEQPTEFTEEPPFAFLTHMCTLLFTDIWDQNWATDGTKTWRRPHPALVC